MSSCPTTASSSSSFPRVHPLVVPHIEALKAFRHDMHQHPELAYDEHRAGDCVVKFMQTLLGITEPLRENGQKGAKSGTAFKVCGNDRGSIHRGLGGTGVVVSIFGQKNRNAQTPIELIRPSVALRADIDALPITEQTGLAYASKHEGKMHACGHDGHTTMLVGAAILLANQQQQQEETEKEEGGAFEGVVHLIFQPAEEGGAGAEAMMQDGLFTLFPCSAVYGMHNWPQLPFGEMAVRKGPIMAGSNRFVIRVVGKGGHAAMPHTTVDPIPIACAIVTHAQSIVSRNVDPLDAAVITFGTIHAGTVENIIPTEAVLSGTIRYLRRTTEEMCIDNLKRIAENVAAAHGAVATFTRNYGYPPTTNTGYEAAFMAKVMSSVVGEANHHPQIEAAMTSEDFGFMLEALPGAYGWVGNGRSPSASSSASSSCCSAGLHNPNYNFNDDNIGVGATFWNALARKWLAEGYKGQPASVPSTKL